MQLRKNFKLKRHILVTKSRQRQPHVWYELTCRALRCLYDCSQLGFTVMDQLDVEAACSGR